jgi:hypothetical protein
VGSIKPVAVIILGADALLAARPATPIQLWHACLAAGYDLAVPATWGDELIAAEALRAAASHPETVAVMCSCPMVARAVGDGDTDLSAHLISLVAPPVATARYLRRVYGERRVHITFAGACPSAADSAIDAWLTPPELLERFSVNAIDLARQPQLFESVLPPDRRRHLSQPGGLPAAERGAVLPRARQVVEIDDADVLASLRRHLMGSVRALVDVAPRLGCACSGASPGVAASEARLAVTLLEPPRSARPVLPDAAGLGLLRRVPPRISTPRPAVGDEARSGEPGTTPIASRSDAGDERARPVATSRPATRSPLSWNLRERALPQPSTGGRAPIVIDSVTAAAVRALEAAAKGHGSASKAAGDPATASSPIGSPPQAPSSPQTPSSPPTPSSPLMPASPTIASPRGRSTTESGGTRPSGDDPAGRTVRATPPGGYWFVSPPAGDAADAEVRAAPSVEPRTESPSPATSGVHPVQGDDDATNAESSSSSDGATDGGHEAAGGSAASPGADVTAEPLAAGDAGSASPPAIAPPVESSLVAATDPESAASHSAPDASSGNANTSPDDSRTPPASTSNGDSPDRGWVVAMTIILLLAGTMVVRDAVRRVTEPPSAATPSDARGASESVVAAGKRSADGSDRSAVSLDSLFFGPALSGTTTLPATSRAPSAGR